MVDLINKALFKDFVPPITQDTLADAQVEDRSLRRQNFSPMLLSGIVVDVLRQHFGNPSSIFDPLLQDRIWRPSDATSILIETCTKEVLTQIQQRPAILVKRNAIKFESFMLNNEVVPMGATPGREFGMRARGSHTVFCITTSSGNTEALAQETWMLLLQFSPRIRSLLRLQRDFEIEEIGELRTLEGIGGQYVVPLTFTYAVDHTWILKSTAPQVRHVQMNTNIR
jgi:hypothetical protein